jgi:hypothetical protein
MTDSRGLSPDAGAVASGPYGNRCQAQKTQGHWGPADKLGEKPELRLVGSNGSRRPRWGWPRGEASIAVTAPAASGGRTRAWGPSSGPVAHGPGRRRGGGPGYGSRDSRGSHGGPGAIVGSGGRPVRSGGRIIVGVSPAARSIRNLGARLITGPGPIGRRAVRLPIVAVVPRLVGGAGIIMGPCLRRPETLVGPLSPLPGPGGLVIMTIFSPGPARCEPLASRLKSWRALRIPMIP